MLFSRQRAKGLVVPTDKEKIEQLTRQLLELAPLAESEGADMLAYLIHMAVAEADDVLSGRRPIDARPRSDDPDA